MSDGNLFPRHEAKELALTSCGTIGRGRGRPRKRPTQPATTSEESRILRREALALAGQQLRAANEPELTSPHRIGKLLELNASVLAVLLQEALADHPDPDRSQAAARALTALKDTVAMVARKHEMETVDSFDPRSPRFGVVFGWFIELVHRLLSSHADQTTVANVFNDLVGELAGWEDRIERQFRGVAAKAIATLPSPFATNFNERVAAAAAELNRTCPDHRSRTAR